MADLMKGKRGLVMGVANDRSIAWGIASALAAEGAELAFSYQGEAFGKRVQPLAASVGSDFLIDVDVTNEESLDACFAAVGQTLGIAGFRDPRHRLFGQDRTDGPLHQHDQGQLPEFAEHLLLQLHRCRPPCRAADAERRQLITLTFQGSNKVVAELQRDGRGQGGAGIGHAVSGQ
jgi:enoyl-[acyl-carrier protein] reductase I